MKRSRTKPRESRKGRPSASQSSSQKSRASQEGSESGNAKGKDSAQGGASAAKGAGHDEPAEAMPAAWPRKGKGGKQKGKGLEPNKRPAPDPASERKVRRRVSFDDTSVGSGPEGASACLEPSAVDVRILLPSLKSVPAGPSSMWTPDSSAGKQPKILNCILNLDI